MTVIMVEMSELLAGTVMYDIQIKSKINDRNIQ